MYQVLLVDDDYMVLKGLEKLIRWEELGIELAGTAMDGQEAYDFVWSHHIDIVVTDVSMPHMNGIEFVRQTQKENLNFYVVLLSGYQEFEYVKEGIQLGVENFLLKPIDKEALNETLKNTVQKLELEKYRLESDKLLFDNTVERWVQDDIDITDLRRFFLLLGHPLDPDDKYTAMIFEGDIDAMSTICLAMKQPYFYEDDNRFILVHCGDKEALDDFRHEVQKRLKLRDTYIGMGEMFVDVDDVSLSYEQAEQQVKLTKFYEGHPISNILTYQNQLQSEDDLVEVSFKKFHQALSIRDDELVYEEINAIFIDLKKNQAQPNYIRYIGFVLVSDIYREFGSNEEETMNQAVQKIYHADNIVGIEAVIYDVYNRIQKDIDFNTYSPLIKQLLIILMNRFHEDLSLSIIAEELHVNPMYLGQLFKKELGINFSKYLNSVRIKEAQLLLLNTNLNVSEIAEKVGYSSSGYFYKKFKKECGLSPTEYRNEYQV